MENNFLKKIQIWSFYAFIFLLPWQAVFLLREPFIAGEKWQYGTIEIYLSDIFLILFLILSLINFKKRLKIKFTFNSIPLLLTVAFLTLSFLSIIWSPDKLLTFYFSLKLLLGISLFFFIQKISINWQRVIFILLASAILQSSLGIWQFTQQQIVANKFFGISTHSAWQGGVSVIESESGRWLRAYGGLSHPNVFGGYLTVVLLLAIFFIIKNTPKKSKNIPNKKFHPYISKYRSEQIQRTFFYCSILIVFSGIILSFSRNAWATLIIGFFVLLVYYWRHKRRRQQLIKVFFLFFVITAFLISIYPSLFFTRATMSARLEQKSLHERQSQFQEARKIIGNNFWLGVGTGNYTQALSTQEQNKKPIWQYQPAHNVFLLIWAELGILGLILFLIILITPFFLQVGNIRTLKFIPYFLFSTFSLLLFFDHWLWTSHFGLLFFFLILGLTIKFSINKNPNSAIC